MSALIDPEDLAHETDLVWLEDPSTLDYVRQSLERLPSRKRKPAYHLGRVVGYAKLSEKSKAGPSGTFRRRVFWLLPHDRDSEPNGTYSIGAPGEAVDPQTLAAGKPGYKTERSEGGPPSEAEVAMGISLPKHA